MFDNLYGKKQDTNAQIEMACGIIRDDPKLQNGFNSLGFSQVYFIKDNTLNCTDA